MPRLPKVHWRQSQKSRSHSWHLEDLLIQALPLWQRQNLCQRFFLFLHLPTWSQRVWGQYDRGLCYPVRNWLLHTSPALHYLLRRQYNQLEHYVELLSFRGQRCASNYGLNWASISTCAYGPQGIQLHYQYGVKTNNLVPKHTYVPWIVVNGQHSTASENAVQSNMVSFICKTYKGSIKIAACSW